MSDANVSKVVERVRVFALHIHDPISTSTHVMLPRPARPGPGTRGSVLELLVVLALPATAKTAKPPGSDNRIKYCSLGLNTIEVHSGVGMLASRSIFSFMFGSYEAMIRLGGHMNIDPFVEQAVSATKNTNDPLPGHCILFFPSSIWPSLALLKPRSCLVTRGPSNLSFRTLPSTSW